MPMQIDRTAILAQLSAGDDPQTVGDQHGIHPLLICHMLRQLQKIETLQAAGPRVAPPVRSAAPTGGGKVANRRRTKLDPETLRAAIEEGRPIKTIAADEGVLVVSIYKALRRWNISFDPSNQNAKERLSDGSD
jgi:hypothetical protein